MTERRFLSERELSAYAGFSTRTLQSWRLRHQGPPFKKFGGGRTSAVRYDIESFLAWAEAQPGGGGAK